MIKNKGNRNHSFIYIGLYIFVSILMCVGFFGVFISIYDPIQTTGNPANYYNVVFNKNSWTTISKVSNEIKENNYSPDEIYDKYGWSVGDEKNLVLTDGSIITLCIMGFNHDDLSDGTGKASIGHYAHGHGGSGDDVRGRDPDEVAAGRCRRCRYFRNRLHQLYGLCR